MMETYQGAYYPIHQPGIVLEMPGEKLIGLEVEVEDRRGMLRDILEVLESKGVFIKSLVHTERVNGRVLIFIVIDVNRSTPREECRPEKLVEMLKAVEGVLSVNISPRYKSIVYTEKIYPYNFIIDRAIVLGAANLAGLAIGLRKQVGEEIASMILLSLGTKVGEQIASLYYKLLDTDRLSDLVRFLRILGLTGGWGVLKEYAVKGNRITLVFEDLWECTIMYYWGEKPRADYTRGILKGYFSKIFNDRVEVEQVGFTKKGETITCIMNVERVASKTIPTVIERRRAR